jgi:hypothetical protein
MGISMNIATAEWMEARADKIAKRRKLRVVERSSLGAPPEDRDGAGSACAIVYTSASVVGPPRCNSLRLSEESQDMLWKELE